MNKDLYTNIFAHNCNWENIPLWLTGLATNKNMMTLGYFDSGYYDKKIG